MEKNYQSDHHSQLETRIDRMKEAMCSSELEAVGSSQQHRCPRRIDHLERMDAAQSCGLHELGNAGGEP